METDNGIRFYGPSGEPLAKDLATEAAKCVPASLYATLFERGAAAILKLQTGYLRLCRERCNLKSDLAEATKRKLPEKLDLASGSPLAEVLRLMPWTTGPIAHRLRAMGWEIPTKCEDEQAVVMHWLLGLALEHGEGWGKAANAYLKQPAEEAADA